MSYRDRLMAEINGALDDFASRGAPLQARWVTHAICQRHESAVADSEDGEFWRWTGYTATRDAVARAIRARAGDRADRSPSPRQISLPGFERDHLQDYYIVERDGEAVGIPVVELTDEELDAKAEVHRKMGAACYAHADEIDRFKHWRADVDLTVIAMQRSGP